MGWKWRISKSEPKPKQFYPSSSLTEKEAYLLAKKIVKFDHWRVMVIWECELNKLAIVKSRLSKFLCE